MGLLKKVFKFLILFAGPISLMGYIDSLDSFEYQKGIGVAIAFIFVLCLVYLALWVLRGLWRFGTQPPGEDSWRFVSDDSPWLTSYDGTSVGERAKWLKDEIKDLKDYQSNEFTASNRQKRKLAKFEKELKSLKKKYSSTEQDVRAVRRKEKITSELSSKRIHRAKYGEKASKIVCPHCGEKGSVWRNTEAKSIEKTRETGVGAVIGRKTITEKKVTILNCKNCGTAWEV